MNTRVRFKVWSFHTGGVSVLTHPQRWSSSLERFVGYFVGYVVGDYDADPPIRNGHATVAGLGEMEPGQNPMEHSRALGSPEQSTGR